MWPSSTAPTVILSLLARVTWVKKKSSSSVRLYHTQGEMVCIHVLPHLVHKISQVSICASSIPTSSKAGSAVTVRLCFMSAMLSSSTRSPTRMRNASSVTSVTMPADRSASSESARILIFSSR